MGFLGFGVSAATASHLEKGRFKQLEANKDHD
jgi:hypothetical protein